MDFKAKYFDSLDEIKKLNLKIEKLKRQLDQRIDDSSSDSEDDNDLIMWHTVIKDTWPGQWSALRKAQKDLILDRVTVFLEEQFGSVEGYSLLEDAKDGERQCLAIPRFKCEEFADWLMPQVEMGMLTI